jgi:hypothetical protein
MNDVCEHKAAEKELPGRISSVTVAGVQFKMFVYESRDNVRDIVSESITGSGSWERSETEKLMSLLRCGEGAQGLRGTKTCEENTSTRGVFLDIGSNIGWYSLVASQLGHDVIAFEPFKSNTDLICASLGYTSPQSRQRFRLHQLGLHVKRLECELFQQKHVNIGDTVSVCDANTRAHYLSLGHSHTSGG